jgi:ribose-phosphate pyrophosphokinase
MSARRLLLVGPAGRHLGDAVAAAAGLEPVTASERRFPDGETCVRADADLAGAEVVVLQGTHPPQDRNLQQAFQLVEQAAHGGAGSIGVVSPYLAYARQDRRSSPGEPLSLAIVARTLEMLGASWIVTVDVHNPAALARVAADATSLSSSAAISAHLAQQRLAAPVVVAPDVGARARAAEIAEAIGADALMLEKRKDGDGRTEYETPDARLGGRDLVVVDDLCSSGSTLAPLAGALERAGASAERMHFVVVHLLADEQQLRARLPTGATIAATDTVPGPMATIAIGPAIGAAVAARLG